MALPVPHTTCAACGRRAGLDDRFCAGCGAALPDGAQRERRGLATVVFCDVVESTALGERLDPETLRDVMGRYFAAVAGALRGHGGEVEKFIGDAVMCVFGLARAREDDALRACRAALDALAAVERLNAELETTHALRLAVRLGVESGEVVVGDPHRGPALVTGGAVTTAARLQQAAPPGAILLGPLTRKLAGPRVLAAPRDPLEAKGKADPIAAWLLLGTAGGAAGAAAGDLVGREHELAALRGALADSERSGRCVVRLIVGEPGVGKSRLAHELLAATAGATARCDPAEGLAFWPLRELVESAGAAAPPALLAAVGLGGGGVAAQALPPALAGLLRGGPGVLVVEDVHWAQDALLDVLVALAGEDTGPLLLLLTGRPETLERRPDLQPLVTRLQPLAPAAAEALIARLGETDPRRRRALVDAAGGNPLFLEQLHAAGGAGMPPSLRALIGARLDALDPEARPVVEAAAVIGVEFWAESVAAIMEGSADLDRALSELQRRELIVAGRTRPGDPRPSGLSGVFAGAEAFSFRHGLVQEVAYASTSKARRAAMHAAFSDALSRRGAPAALVAWHVERAAVLRRELHGDARPLERRAVALLEEAGRDARASGDPEGATQLLDRAARLQPGGDELGQAELGAGDELGGYVIEGVAGRGGMGVVYRGWDAALRRRVALKVIAPRLARDPAFRSRFEREARLAAGLEHPGIVPVYRAGDDDGRLFLAMRYVDGIDLATTLAQRGRLAPDAAVNVVRQVARALDAAHARGLVHRDVKPANVLLAGEDGSPRAFLTDFGLTVERDAQNAITRTGQVVGTVAYIAPEQVRGEQVDGRADVYALGGVLYHCLTGEVPFPVDHELDALAAHLHAPPPRPSRALDGLPRRLDDVVAAAMAKDPEQRPSSAGELARAAQAAIAGGPLPAGFGRARRSGRRPWVALAAGLALAAVVTAFIAIVPGGGASGTNRRTAGKLGPPLPVAGRPDSVAVAAGRVWTETAGLGSLQRTDPRTGRSVDMQPPVSLGGGSYEGLAAGADAVWQPQSASGSGGVTKIEPRTGDVLGHVRLPGATAVAADRGGVWVTTVLRGRGGLVRLDPRSLRVLAGPVDAGRTPAAVARAGDSLWVADERRDELLRFDPRKLRLRGRVKVGDGPAALAAGAGALWVMNSKDRTLMHLDPRTRQVSGGPVSLGKELQAIAGSPHTLWVAAADSTVTRLDPRTGRRQGAPTPVGRAPLAIAAEGERLWVASAADHTVRRLDP